jgi:hypothetical protein
MTGESEKNGQRYCTCAIVALVNANIVCLAERRGLES